MQWCANFSLPADLKSKFVHRNKWKKAHYKFILASEAEMGGPRIFSVVGAAIYFVQKLVLNVAKNTCINCHRVLRTECFYLNDPNIYCCLLLFITFLKINKVKYLIPPPAVIAHGFEVMFHTQFFRIKHFTGSYSDYKILL